jgi:hypothetical protein
VIASTATKVVYSYDFSLIPTLTPRSRTVENVDIHKILQVSTKNSRLSSTVLVCKVNALSLPVCPVHHVIMQCQAERMLQAITQHNLIFKSLVHNFKDIREHVSQSLYLTSRAVEITRLDGFPPCIHPIQATGCMVNGQSIGPCDAGVDKHRTL